MWLPVAVRWFPQTAISNLVYFTTLKNRRLRYDTIKTYKLLTNKYIIIWRRTKEKTQMKRNKKALRQSKSSRPSKQFTTGNYYCRLCQQIQIKTWQVLAENNSYGTISRHFSPIICKCYSASYKSKVISTSRIAATVDFNSSKPADLQLHHNWSVV